MQLHSKAGYSMIGLRSDKNGIILTLKYFCLTFGTKKIYCCKGNGSHDPDEGVHGDGGGEQHEI